MSKRGRPEGYITTEETKALLRSYHEERTNYYKRKVSVDGVVFESVTAAATHFRIKKGNVVYRIKNVHNNPKFTGWCYL